MAAVFGSRLEPVSFVFPRVNEQIVVVVWTYYFSESNTSIDGYDRLFSVMAVYDTPRRTVDFFNPPKCVGSVEYSDKGEPEW